MKALLALALLAAAPAPPVSQRPDLLLVTLDTTRADRLGVYGHRGELTPNLDALARHAVVFEQATTPAPLTLPAHASLFTGLHPRTHGARVNGETRLGEEWPTLAELARDSGYRTAAVVGSWVLARHAGLARGFEHYDDALPADTLERDAEQVTAAALAWIERQPEDRPLLLWVHYFDPHTPYAPPASALKQAAGSAYDGEIAWLDRQLGRLVYRLRRLGRLQHTLWVIAGDHGEALGEHGEQTHGKLLHDATVRVPLIVAWPGAEGQRRVSAPVSLLDLLPTLCSGLRLAAPERLDGRSLAPLLSGELARWPEPRGLLLEAPRLEWSAERGGSALLAWRDPRHKLVRGAGRSSLYDLVADPGELHDLWSGRRELGEQLERRLQLRLGTLGRERWQALPPDPERLERLRALGYLAGAE